MPELYVVRHAEPAVVGRLLGRTDPPLGDAGRMQAREVLAQLRVERVYTSPLLRARQTAEAIDAPVTIVAELAEIALGEWDGLTWAEIEERWPEQARRKSEAWFQETPPGGEAWPDFVARVTRALGEIRRGPLPAAVVAHVAVNSVIHQELSGIAPAGFLQEHCEIKEYELAATD